VVSIGKAKTSPGISPTNSFSSSESVCSALKFFNAGGILPVRKLLESVRIPRESPEIFGGSSPLKRLLASSIISTEGSLKIPDGMAPFKIVIGGSDLDERLAVSNIVRDWTVEEVVGDDEGF